ncbi:hypothetical protein F4778DRAFT_447688 [Xylariomycetidae sp. FL2044]|nr:hypothetical protein F4778DRAFT_447688 [Xylariomycetidae sp. FL2044]
MAPDSLATLRRDIFETLNDFLWNETTTHVVFLDIMIKFGDYRAATSEALRRLNLTDDNIQYIRHEQPRSVLWAEFIDKVRSAYYDPYRKKLNSLFHYLRAHDGMHHMFQDRYLLGPLCETTKFQVQGNGAYVDREVFANIQAFLAHLWTKNVIRGLELPRMTIHFALKSRRCIYEDFLGGIEWVVANPDLPMKLIKTGMLNPNS